jgi:hypothetical protein
MSLPAAPVAALAQEPKPTQHAAPQAPDAGDRAAPQAPRSAKKNAEQSLLRRWQNTPSADETAQRPRSQTLAFGTQKGASRTPVQQELRTPRNVFEASDGAETFSDDGAGFDSDVDTQRESATQALDTALAALPEAQAPEPGNTASSREPQRWPPPAPQAVIATAKPSATPRDPGSEAGAALPVTGQPVGAPTRLPEAHALQALGHGIEPFRASGVAVRRAIVFTLIFVALAALAVLGAQLGADPPADEAAMQPAARASRQTPEPER